MNTDYKNWIPKGMIKGFAAGTAAFSTALAVSDVALKKSPWTTKIAAKTVLTAGALGCGAMTLWCLMAYERFSYKGHRQLSKAIVEGTAEYVNLPENGIGLDVGCGSGALTIACAKRNPDARMIGIDSWGKEYASFSKNLCINNALAEGVNNVKFAQGNAIKLDFPNETFDAITSNYVYHNIVGVNKQQLLRESLRVLKKGGTFAIHDIMSKQRYGDMQQFVEELKNEGYEDVQLIPTDEGLFMSSFEAAYMMLKGSCLLVGKK